ncbi:MAG TPA: ABC transporter permease [Chloroflexi bacterium]|nr:ABC transporter permease [Chloroflexota bacterium]
MSERVTKNVWPVVPILLALLTTTLLVLLVGADAGVTYQALFDGAFGTSDRTFSTLAFWVPLMLCATGLLITFTAGLWNIGVEGQMIMGAIASSWVALKVAAVYPDIPGWAIIPLELLLAAGAGALWAALAAVLKVRGGVHEIFGGVALNNLAIITTNYLISGPWQPPEGGSFRGTVPFPEHALLPLLGNTRFSPLSAVLALALLLLIGLALRGTFWGLKLKALGNNLRSAFLLGISSEREAIMAMMLGGALAGLAGSVRVLSWFDSLRQSISGGIGFLAILIVLLAGLRPVWTLLIALIFSALLNGGTIVQLRTQLHSSLSGIIQGLLVLFVLLFGDYRRVFRPKQTLAEELQHE